MISASAEGKALEIQADISKPEQRPRRVSGDSDLAGGTEVLLLNAAAGPLGNVNEVNMFGFAGD